MEESDREFFWESVQYRCGAGAKGIKVLDGDVIMAIVAYDYWTPNSANMHIWIGDVRVLESSFLPREAFNYLFNTCKRTIAIGVTPAHNTASLRFQHALGFKEQYRVKDGWAIGDDMVVSELRKQDCIWLRSRENDDSPAEDAPARVTAKLDS